MSYMWIAVYSTLSAYDLFEKKNYIYIQGMLRITGYNKLKRCFIKINSCKPQIEYVFK